MSLWDFYDKWGNLTHGHHPVDGSPWVLRKQIFSSGHYAHLQSEGQGTGWSWKFNPTQNRPLSSFRQKTTLPRIAVPFFTIVTRTSSPGWNSDLEITRAPCALTFSVYAISSPPPCGLCTRERRTATPVGIRRLLLPSGKLTKPI
jgi:hypothetical protein